MTTMTNTLEDPDKIPTTVVRDDTDNIQDEQMQSAPSYESSKFEFSSEHLAYQRYLEIRSLYEECLTAKFDTYDVLQQAADAYAHYTFFEVLGVKSEDHGLVLLPSQLRYWQVHLAPRNLGHKRGFYEDWRMNRVKLLRETTSELDRIEGVNLVALAELEPLDKPNEPKNPNELDRERLRLNKTDLDELLSMHKELGEEIEWSRCDLMDQVRGIYMT